MPARSPEEVDRLLIEAINGGDVEAAVSLYESGGAFAAQPGQVLTGSEAIREALKGFVAMKPTFTAEVKTIAVAGDIALTSAKWSMTGTGPDGSPVSLAGESTEVVRRQPSGDWLFVIDTPWGLEWQQ